MADYEKKAGQGAAFKKEKLSPNHPDYTGSFLTPDGKELWISIWEKTSAKGMPYFSIAVSEPREQKPATQTARPYQSAPKPMQEPEESGDLPF